MKNSIKASLLVGAIGLLGVAGLVWLRVDTTIVVIGVIGTLVASNLVRIIIEQSEEDQKELDCNE